jgi:hypothetical protein
MTDGLQAQVSGSVNTTSKDGTAVNFNLYPAATDVYAGGAPQNKQSSGLPDGAYYFQVADPSGKTLLSTDNAACRPDGRPRQADQPPLVSAAIIDRPSSGHAAGARHT